MSPTSVTVSDVDPAQFRQLLGRFATGVVVVTTQNADGAPAGMTANSLASVSLEPPLVSLCVERAAHLHDALQRARGFVINVLAEHQEAVSRRFAGPHPNRFDGIGYTLNDRGLAVLDGTLAHIECERFAEYPGGDHTIVVGRVIGGATGEGRPLLYYRGGYAALG
ncbi:MAG TPA: flavin reductase family protein [Gemmatimonadales bacterium]|nr:flavin reductase family protein [Gemmatimonadales bacterium]